jgi:tRNA splicing endonuclease
MGFEAKAEVYADLRPRGYRMRYGPRNGIVARIAYVKSSEVKPHAKFEVEVSVERIRW